MSPVVRLNLLIAFFISLASICLADEIELRDGRKLVGQVLSQAGNQVQFRVVYPNGGSADMTISRMEVVSIKLAPLPKVEPPKVEPPKVEPPKVEPPPAGEPPEAEEPEEQPVVTSGEKPPTSQPAATGPRSMAELDALIDQAGRLPPDWWASQPDNFPKTLDAAWPDKPAGGWNPAKNPGQYFIEAINRGGATRGKEAAKAGHYLLANCKDDKAVQFKTMLRLGQIYGVILQDYARGAFWFRKAAKIGKIPPGDAANFAYCYWKLGANALAVAELNKAGFNVQGVRMLGQIGEVARAVQLARGGPADLGNLAAGDVLRFAGRFKEAAEAYKKAANSGGRNQKVRDLGAASADAMAAFEKVDLAKIADGKYSGESGGGYRGPIKVEVAVRAGRIESVVITSSSEDWPMNAQVLIPACVVSRQSVRGIDTITGATFTSGAIINAIGKALGDAAK